MVSGARRGEGRVERGCQLEGVLEGGAIASRWGVRKMGEGACEKSPGQLESGLFFSAAGSSAHQAA